jgi:hypothetical protein
MDGERRHARVHARPLASALARLLDVVASHELELDHVAGVLEVDAIAKPRGEIDADIRRPAVDGSGKLAFVSVRVLLPIKGPSRSAPLVLFAALVQDGSRWRWVSLQYGATDR